MIDVIPAINCHRGDSECVRKKILIGQEFAEWVHLDVADGIFTPNKTWSDPQAWRSFGVKLKLEAHLMLDEPEEVFEDWLEAGAKRLIVHMETVNAALAKAMADVAKRHGAEVMISSNPETPSEKYEPFFQVTKLFQVLAVHPGFAGQKFLPPALDKIKFLRARMPDAAIEVDGGVSPETGRRARAAGADILISADHIFGNGDPRRAYEELKNL